MIDAALAPIVRRVLGPPARALAARGVSADGLTLAGFVLGALAVLALAFGAFGLALVLFAANRLADGLDGEVARHVGPTERGAFLDIALDFILYALFPLGFAVNDPAQNALPAAALIAAFVGTGATFLAFAAVSAKAPPATVRVRHKGIAYLGGLTEGTETIAVFVAMCLFPAAFPVLAWVFAAACVLTTGTRLWQGWAAFGPARG